MPHELRSDPGRVAPRLPIVRPVEAVIIVVGVLLCIGQYVNFSQNSAIRESQKDGEERGYNNRAVICDLQKAQGIAESPGCSTPQVRKYRNPDLQVGSTWATVESTKTRQLVCVVLQQSAKRPGSAIVIPPTYCKDG